MKLPEENNDPAWELLKRARRTGAGPYFSRRVLRDVRQMEQEPRPWFAWLPAWRTAMAGGVTLAATAALCLGAFAWLRQPAGDPAALRSPSPLAALANATPTDADYDPASEVGNLEYLGQLMAVTDPAMLDDAALADLLF